MKDNCRKLNQRNVFDNEHLQHCTVEGMWKVLPLSASENGRYVKDWFPVVCTKDNTVPILNITKLEVMEISVDCTLEKKKKKKKKKKKTRLESRNLEGSPLVFSRRNRFTAVCRLPISNRFDDFRWLQQRRLICQFAVTITL